MSRTVRLLRHISGTRDGLPWPQVGGFLEVPDQEADELIANGIAADDREEEKAVVVHNEEKAVANRSVKAEESQPAKSLDGEAIKRTPRARKTEK